MTHSDDSGLVLPPKVAPSQVVIVPVGRGKKDKDAAVDTFVDKMVAGLKAAGVRYKIDDREKIQPGQKVKSFSPDLGQGLLVWRLPMRGGPS